MQSTAFCFYEYLLSQPPMKSCNISHLKIFFYKINLNFLKGWINKARSTGIERAYEAVVNAICLPCSNGLAEGCVNKIKIIKRVMYCIMFIIIFL